MYPASIIVAALNASWQGAAIVAVAWLALRILRRVNAATACTIWSAAFATIALLPAVNLFLQRSVVEKVPAAPIAITLGAPARETAWGGPLHRHGSAATVAAIEPLHVHVGRTAVPTQQPAALVPQERRHFDPQAALLSFATGTAWLARRLGTTLILGWLLVTLVLLIALVRDYAALRRLKYSALPLERTALESVPCVAGGRRVRVCTSECVRVPCAAGFLHPMVLVPASLVEGLGDEDLRRIVLHEIGHLQRFDDVLHAAERVLRSIFFFQPALWYVASRIAFERELACDDRVLAATGEPIRYAECLTNIVERHVQRRGLVPVPGFLLGRSQVVGRIARLVDRGRNGSVRVPRTAGLAAFGAFALAVGIMLPLQVPLLAACSDRVRAAAHAVRSAAHIHLATRVKLRTQAALQPRLRLAIAAVPRSHSHCMHAHGDSLATVHRGQVRSTAARVAAAHALAAHPIAVARSAERSSNSLAATASALAKAASVVAAASSVVNSEAQAHNAGELARKEAVRSSDLLDALSASGMHPSVDQLIELHDHGVTADQLYAIVDSGIAQPTVDELVASADRGLDRAMLIAAVQTFGPTIPMHDIANLRDAGVTPLYLHALIPLKLRGFSVVDTVALAQNGVTPAYIAALQDAGYSRFDARALVRLHDNGIDAVFLKSLAQHGLHDLPLGRILELHDSGETS